MSKDKKRSLLWISLLQRERVREQACQEGRLSVAQLRARQRKCSDALPLIGFPWLLRKTKEANAAKEDSAADTESWEQCFLGYSGGSVPEPS